MREKTLIISQKEPSRHQFVPYLEIFEHFERKRGGLGRFDEYILQKRLHIAPCASIARISASPAATASSDKITEAAT